MEAAIRLVAIPTTWCGIIVVGMLLHMLAVRRTRREALEDAARLQS
jgi:hypothetical protein